MNCVCPLQYNSALEVAVSVDDSGMLEYWTGPKSSYQFPENICWQYKTDTDLYEFAKVGEILVLYLFFFVWKSEYFSTPISV